MKGSDGGAVDGYLKMSLTMEGRGMQRRSVAGCEVQGKCGMICYGDVWFGVMWLAVECSGVRCGVPNEVQ